MSIARTAVVVSAGLTVPTILYAPKPLYSGPGTASTEEYDYKVLSQLAKSGFTIYERHCQDCHGDRGYGTDRGPNLHHRVYSAGKLSQQEFHEAVVHGVKANKWTYGDMPATRLSFNEIERVARYVREVRRLDDAN